MRTLASKLENNAEAALFKCSECESKFSYGPLGFPDYCPDCGESFDETEDLT